MLENIDFVEKLNNQSYTSSTQQKPLTIDDIQRVFNDIKEVYENNTEKHCLPISPEEYLQVALLPSRRHEDDVPGTILIENCWSRLNLPIIVDDPRDSNNDVDREARIAWFKENFAHRINAAGKPIYIVGRLHEDERREP